MSKVNGRLVTCDRCGNHVFTECVGEGERDGGFTRWNKFEPVPKGWSSRNGKDLCPECFREWNKIETEFMNKTENFFKVGSQN